MAFNHTVSRPYPTVRLCIKFSTIGFPAAQLCLINLQARGWVTTIVAFVGWKFRILALGQTIVLKKPLSQTISYIVTASAKHCRGENTCKIYLIAPLFIGLQH